LHSSLENPYFNRKRIRAAALQGRARPPHRTRPSHIPSLCALIKSWLRLWNWKGRFTSSCYTQSRKTAPFLGNRPYAGASRSCLPGTCTCQKGGWIY